MERGLSTVGGRRGQRGERRGRAERVHPSCDLGKLEREEEAHGNLHLVAETPLTLEATASLQAAQESIRGA